MGRNRLCHNFQRIVSKLQNTQKKNRAIYFEKRALKKHPVGIKKNRASKKKLESLVSMGNKTVHFCRICIVLEVAPLARKVFAGHWTWKSRIRMFC